MPASCKVASEDGEEVSPYLLTEPRLLRDVCRALRHDNGGRQCPSCSIREFCEGQARRAGKPAAVD